MSRVLEHLAERRGDPTPVISCGSERVTASALFERVQELARRLRTLPPGAIALSLDNGVEWVVADLATLAAGRVCVPLRARRIVRPRGRMERISGHPR